MLGDRMVELQLANDGVFADLEVGQCLGSSIAALLSTEYEVENHFQFQLYSNPFLPPGNDESHTCL
jgi:hypothetical protein